MESLVGLWRRRSLRGRSLVVLTLMVVLVVAGAGSILYTLGIEQRAADQMAADRALLYRLQQLDSALQTDDVAVKAFLRTGEPSFRDSADEFSERARVARAGMRGQVRPELDRSWRAWGDWAVAARSAVTQGQVAPSGTIADGGDQLFEQLAGNLQGEEARVAAAAAGSEAVSRRLMNRLRLTTLVAAGLGLLMLLGTAWAISTWTLAPIRRLVGAARALAAGESVVIPDGEVGGEVGQLARALASWERASRERLTLAQAMVEAGTETDLDRVIAGGSERLRQLLGAAVVSVTVTGAAGGGTSRILRPGSIWDQFEHQLFPGGPAAQAAETRKSVTTDLRSPAWPETIRGHALSEGLGPALAVPMLSAGDLVGVVGLVRLAGEAAFTAAEVGRAELMLQPLAGAIRVATLFNQLRQANAELIEASRHKSEFLATMSHELRTPLNSILGFSQLLESSDFGDLTDRQRRYVDHIHSSGGHLLALINDVLDLSKVEAGQLELTVERVNLEEAVDQCLNRMRPQGDAKRLRLHCQDLTGVAVRADARRLQQVLLNLISNAIKFTPEGGEVLITATAAGDHALVSVADTGVGIPAEDLERVFDQFTQLRSGRTRVQEGTGLGLALSRRLLELMDGTVEVRSEVGRGSVFTIRLPKAQVRMPTPASLTTR